MACWDAVYWELSGRHPLLHAELSLSPSMEGEFVVDSQGLRFASPLDLAAIAAFTHIHAVRGLRPTIALPVNPDVTSYLQRMDLLEHLPVGVQVEGKLLPQQRQDRSRNLLEVTPLSPSTETEVGERIGQLAWADLGPKLAAMAFRGVGELIDNAVSHGRSDIGAFIAAQVYTGRTSGFRRLEVAICDSGVGVLNHLRRNPAYRNVDSSHEALSRALRPGVSGTDEVRGHGLPDLIKIAGRGGQTRLVLRSGNGWASAIGPGDPTPVRIRPAADSIGGTWAWLRVSFQDI